jgi:hypothetical protein
MPVEAACELSAPALHAAAKSLTQRSRPRLRAAAQEAGGALIQFAVAYKGRSAERPAAPHAPESRAPAPTAAASRRCAAAPQRAPCGPLNGHAQAGAAAGTSCVSSADHDRQAGGAASGAPAAASAQQGAGDAQVDLPAQRPGDADTAVGAARAAGGNESAAPPAAAAPDGARCAAAACASAPSSTEAPGGRDGSLEQALCGGCPERVQEPPGATVSGTRPSSDHAGMPAAQRLPCAPEAGSVRGGGSADGGTPDRAAVLAALAAGLAAGALPAELRVNLGAPQARLQR